MYPAEPVSPCKISHTKRCSIAQGVTDRKRTVPVHRADGAVRVRVELELDTLGLHIVLLQVLTLKFDSTKNVVHGAPVRVAQCFVRSLDQIKELRVATVLGLIWVQCE